MRTSALIANGEISSIEKLKIELQKYERVVAVDGGLSQCQKMGIIPDLIVGDFDSCPKGLVDVYSSVPKVILPEDKDETDLEVAIREEFQRKADKITVFGSWGNRIDHSLTNALIVGRFPQKLFLETETEILFALKNSAYLSVRKGQIVSLIPLFGAASGITTKGLKWELKNGKLDFHFIGISNVCLQENISIEIDQGMLLCCVLK